MRYILLNLLFAALYFLSTFSVKAQTLDEKINELISQMTLEEKVKQLHQEGLFNTADNTKLNIPGFRMADGPHGVRLGLASSFPVGMGLAATWDVDLVYQVGVAMGKEFHAKGIHQALGPCLDLTIDPRNGRSPESTSEDPFLNGKINTAIVKGIQSTPVIATIKHFYTEYRQAGRTSNNYTLSQRNLLDQHGLQFKEAIQEGGAFSVMNSYNSLNGKSASKNSDLLTNTLRTKWGFPFYVVSDWNSVYSNPGDAVSAGCDIEMGSELFQSNTGGLLDLVKSGKLSESIIDKSVARVLRTKFLSGMIGYYPQGNPADVNSLEHQSLVLEAGKKGLVLLKNSDGILPLDKNKINKIAVIGPNAAVMQTDGSGSSWVDPYYKISPKEGIEQLIGASKVLYAKGCEISGSNYSSDLNDAINYASQSDVVIFVGGLDASQEGEGFDRVNNSIELPGRQKDVIKLLSSVNKNLIVVLISGGVCTPAPIINDIKGLIYGFYPGQEGGKAIAQILFGEYNPSGKLPVTIPINDSQMNDRNSNNLDNTMGGGYRWFDSKNHSPLYPFGFGLSFTTFQFSNFKTSHSNWFFAEDEVTISVDVKNTGSRSGEEVVQLYLFSKTGYATKNIKDLKGFKKVFLNANETKTVSFVLNPSDFYYFNQRNNSYELDPGTYIFSVGNSSDNLIFSKSIDLRPHPPLPDLQIANIYSVPRFPLEGDKVTFLATVVNKGTGPSPQATFHEVVFKVNGDPVSRSLSVADSIPKGGMALACANIGEKNINENFWIAGKPGTYTIEAVVDDRFSITESNKNNNTKISQLKVYNAPAINLALKKQVNVSSIESNDYAGSLAVDGNFGTRWSSKFSDPQWMTIDLGTNQKFNQLRIIWEFAFGKEYIIETSDDAINWIKMVDQKNGSGGIENWNVDAAARYIRFVFIKRATQYGYSIYEVEVYNNLSTNNYGMKEQLPSKYTLSNNFPNPFNPTTTINYQLPVPGFVTMKVFDILGREVDVLVDEYKSEGVHNVEFGSANSKLDSKTKNLNSFLNSGVYFYSIIVSDEDGIKFQETKKMIMLK